MQYYDVIIIGAGAAGLMCGIEAAKRGRSVCIIEHVNKPGKKILMSGGGRCNFTNLDIQPSRYLSHNPHFCKSALKRYTQWDFIALVKKHGISFHEKKLGQLFCDQKSKAILEMLLTELQSTPAKLLLNCTVNEITHADNRYSLRSTDGAFMTSALVVASGGLSIPTLGATGFAFALAKQFDIQVFPQRPGLVPFLLSAESMVALPGIAVESDVHHESISFQENILFTHRGLSGPAILQISSYWQIGEAITINLLPHIDLYIYLQTERQHHPNKQLQTSLISLLPKNLVPVFLPPVLLTKTLSNFSNQMLQQVRDTFQAWKCRPKTTEGYRTAEVTLGGIDCDALSSQTMEAKSMPGLYFIGEAVDVTGWLGGYNFQWAWSSGWAAGQVV